MGRLIFLYVNDGGASTPDQYNPDISCRTTNCFANNFTTEGYYCLLEALKDKGVFDEILIFIETTRNPGHIRYAKGIDCYVVPHIAWVDKFLKDGDIIWARGGWRSWHDYLISKKGKHWLCLYAANSGRSRWKFWDVIFNDVEGGGSFIDRWGRYYFDFIKPTNEQIFRKITLREHKEYDICIGASHIHDKKGQWRMIYALDIIKDKIGRNLKCVMPGRFLRGVETNDLPKIIQERGLAVDMPGMISRRELALLMSNCRIFVYAGESGQNDRGPIEALCCGTPISVSSPQRHHPVVWKHEFCKVIDWRDIRKAAKAVYQFYSEINREGDALISLLVRQHYDDTMSLHRVIVPRMEGIFTRLQETPVGSDLNEIRSHSSSSIQP
jgi:hypothetical protein